MAVSECGVACHTKMKAVGSKMAGSRRVAHRRTAWENHWEERQPAGDGDADGDTDADADGNNDGDVDDDTSDGDSSSTS